MNETIDINCPNCPTVRGRICADPTCSTKVSHWQCFCFWHWKLLPESLRTALTVSGRAHRMGDLSKADAETAYDAARSAAVEFLNAQRSRRP
jgi:hypothetical protein